MKLKTIVAACALACTSQAYALAPTTTPDVTLFISGSSALQTMIGQVAKSMFVNGVTATDKTDVFFDGTAAAASGKNYRGYFGVANAAAIAAYPSLETAPGSGIGKKVLIRETALGGSIQGVNPVALSQTVGSINMAGCVMPTTPLVDAATGISVYSCTGVQTPALVPDAGISDVEPATLEATINLPAGGVALSPAQLTALTQKGVLGVVMGIVTTTGSPFTNLTKGQVTGLMGGNIPDWSLIDATATGKSVIVCRRGAGSGTQASINASFFGAPCMTGALSPLTFNGTTAPLASTLPVAAGSVVVVENSSSGNVKTCMAAAKNGTMVNAVGSQAIDVKTGNLVALGAANSVVLPAGGYGIGVLGLDGGTTANYQFSAINGVAATTANASTGAYDVVVQATFNDRGDMTATPKGDLFALFAQYAGDPTILGTGGAAGAPIPGVAALSENGWAAPALFNAAYPVLRVGNFGNTCQPLSTLQ